VLGIVVVLAYGVSWLVARPLLYRGATPAPVQTGPARPLLQAGPLVLDPVGHQVQVEGRRLELTATEFKLLVHLAEHPGEVLSRDELLRSVWGYATPGYSRTVDTHVQRLREKLGAAGAWIETVRGAGYRFRGGGR
jgi:DNA-binding response OmpR family regulator